MKQEVKFNKKVFLAGLVSASILTGCGDSGKSWENAPGTKGFINLDAVKRAFSANQDIEKFESRVNEIFEGDNLLVFKLQSTQNGFTLYAREDINKDRKYDDQDDLIFTLNVHNGRETLKGAGVNKFYKQTWIYSPQNAKHRTGYTGRSHNLFFWGWYMGRYRNTYYTPLTSYSSMNNHRAKYRSSSKFKDQVKQNCSYEKNMSSKYKSSFAKSVAVVSPVRNSYIKSNDGKVKGTSGWTVRSARNSMSSSFANAINRGSGRSSSSRGWGGSFRGFGGFKI